MKRWLSMMLLIGALLGLFAQEAAFASAPVAQLAEQTSVDGAMDVACMEAMGLDEDRSDAPCKGLTLDCIAKMGCALPLAQAPSGYGIIHHAPSNTIPYLLGVNPMTGRESGPEPHPPSRLG